MDKDYLKRAADRCGFVRDFYNESNLPTHRQNIVVLPFFGDIRALCILSYILMPRYKELNKHQYVIICSWKGYKHLFPYVDEYWSFKDNSNARALASKVDDFYNASDADVTIRRNLSDFFENVLTFGRDLRIYYDNGISSLYWKTFENVKVFSPSVLSKTESFNKKLENNIVISPSKTIRSWQNGRVIRMPLQREFWLELVNYLLDNHMQLFSYQNEFTYDLSRELGDKCNYIVSDDIAVVLSALHEMDCAIDVFDGFSKLAIGARCPFVALNERRIFLETKEYEIDDLCAMSPRQYIFAFSGQALTGSGKDDWTVNLFDLILHRIHLIKSSIDINKLPSTMEIYKEVSYDQVLDRKISKRNADFLGKAKLLSK